MTNYRAMNGDRALREEAADARAPAAPVADMKALQAYAATMTAGVAWITVTLTLCAITGLFLFTGLAVAGIWPAWLAALCNIPCFIAAYTGVHEAIHQNFHGKNERFRWLNGVFGTVLMFPFFHSYTMHKYVHLQHHAYTNNREKDPDAWMAVDGAGSILARAFTLVFYYFVYTVRMKLKEPHSGPFLRRAAVETLAPVALGAALAATGRGWAVLIAWIVPALVSVAILGVILDWLVHHPHEGKRRIDTTRIFAAPPGLAGKALTWAYLFQNYHLIHHLFPRAPFYAYERVFQRGETALRNEGATIIHL